MSEPEILFERQGLVGLITLNRPKALNALTHNMVVAMMAQLRAWENDPAIGCVAVRGAGDRAFCAGGDLKSLADGEPVGPTTAEEVEAHNRGERPGILGPSRWTDIHKPTIAAVNGVAYAGGLEWACWCHLAIAEEHASFGVTCRRWNIGLADGGTQRLPRIVGWRRAMELIVTGRVIDAREALEIGLVNEIVAKGAGLDRALELAETIAALPQPAIRTDLEAAERGWGRPLEEGLRIEAECFNRLLGEPEILEGLRRFNERDHPDRDPQAAATTPGLRRGGAG